MEANPSQVVIDHVEHVEHVAAAIEDADFRATANVAAGHIILPERSGRGDVIEYLSRTIPKNEYGLPSFYLRSDFLDLDTIVRIGHVSQEEADMAGELLSYQEGYPTFTSGSPFWTKMAHEPQPAFVLFQNFLDLAEEEGIRLIDSLARKERVELDIIRSHYQEFYWSSRARAYDLFIVAADARKKQVLARKAENTHYEVAGSILEQIFGRFNTEEELISSLSAKELLDVFEQMVKVQRLSLGLTGQNTVSTPRELVNPGQTVEVLLRNLTKNVGLSSEGSTAITDRIGALMADPDQAMNVQELIIRATTNNQVPGSTPTTQPQLPPV